MGNLNRLVSKNKTIAVQLIERVFNKNARKQIGIWRTNTQNEIEKLQSGDLK